MTVPQEASFYEPLPGGKVLCTLYPHDCRISDGGRGVCAVRYNLGGRLYTPVYDEVVARNLEPIAKKPLFHICPQQPGTGRVLHGLRHTPWPVSGWGWTSWI